MLLLYHLDQFDGFRACDFRVVLNFSPVRFSAGALIKNMSSKRGSLIQGALIRGGGGVLNFSFMPGAKSRHYGTA